MHRTEGFISLAALLRDDAPQDAQKEPPAVAVPHDIDAALRAARLFRAGIADAVQNAADAMLSEIASNVLARELQLAPSDVGVIVKRVVDRYFSSSPLRIRLNPEEAPLVDCPLPVVVDPALQAGDVCVDLRDGSIDAKLTTRLDYAIQALTA